MLMKGVRVLVIIVVVRVFPTEVFIQSGSLTIAQVSTFAVSSLEVIQCLRGEVSRSGFRSWDKVFAMIGSISPSRRVIVPFEAREREKKLLC